MGRMPSHRDLIVWQRSMALARRVYQISQSFPPYEMYGLTSQLRRAVVSIPANIAEGHGRRTDGAFARHLDIALGSVAEVDTLLQMAMELNYLSKPLYQELTLNLEEIRRMLHTLYNKVKLDANGKN